MGSWMTLGAIVTAAILAVACGFNLWRAFEGWRRTKRHKESLWRSSASDSSVGAHEASGGAGSLNEAIIGFMGRISRDISLKRGVRLIPPMKTKAKWFSQNAEQAGVVGEVTADGFCEARVRLTFLGCVVGMMVGLVLSMPFAMVMAVVGAYLGWRAPSQAIVSRIKWRAHQTERHLPEMLDVVALGMRSGLSFDTSLSLYSAHFDTVLARELASAQRQWASGLIRRDEALRKVASSYDSVVFGRVVETIIRSIRYGSSMVQSLESDAAEARSAYQSEREERIAKAPVKMMIPTGVLILPAMLMLVLGPVLLELMGGSF